MSHKYELGTTPPAGARDAVHVAIFAATARHSLAGGEPVRMTSHDKVPGYVTRCDMANAIGVADPFATFIEAGTPFWVVLKPGTVTNLRHEWDHPQLDAAKPAPAPALDADLTTENARLKKELKDAKAKISKLDEECEELSGGCRGC